MYVDYPNLGVLIAISFFECMRCILGILVDKRRKLSLILTLENAGWIGCWLFKLRGQSGIAHLVLGLEAS
jgi:hypothetical protein